MKKLAVIQKIIIIFLVSVIFLVSSSLYSRKKIEQFNETALQVEKQENGDILILKKEQDQYKLYEYTTYKFCGLEWYYESGTFAASFDELHEIDALSTAIFITNKNQYIYIIGMNTNYDEIEVIHTINHEVIHADENIPKGLFMKRYILPIHHEASLELRYAK